MVIGKKFGERTAGREFMSGVAALSLSTAVVKIIGVIFKIPLLRIVGVEGMAYFLAAYHIYLLLFVISNSGLPTALALLISDDLTAHGGHNTAKIYRTATAIFLLTGAAGCAFMWVFAEPLSKFIGMEKAYLCIRAIAPSVFFICAASAVRGYFQGCRVMYPTALSQVVESAGKLLLGLTFALYAGRRGYPPETCAAFAIAGITAGIILSAVYLYINKALCKKKYETRIINRSGGAFIADDCGNGTENTTRMLLKIAMPITLGAAAVSLSGLVDTLLISNRLQYIGYEINAANAAYSSYGNLAMPVFSLIPSFISPLVTALVPTLAAAKAAGDKAKQENVISFSTGLCAALVIPSAFGIACFSQPILGMIFSGSGEAVKIAAPLLSVLSLSLYPTCMITLTSGILQAYKRVKVPVLSIIIGTAVKFVSEYLLIGIPELNVAGAPISTFLYSMTVLLINCAFMKKYIRKNNALQKKQLLSLVSALISTAAALIVYHLIILRNIGSTVACLAAILTSVSVYAAAALAFGVFGREELLALPGGEKIVKLLFGGKKYDS